LTGLSLRPQIEDRLAVAHLALPRREKLSTIAVSSRLTRGLRPLHDRVAPLNETVICRHSLAMLRAPQQRPFDDTFRSLDSLFDPLGTLSWFTCLQPARGAVDRPAVDTFDMVSDRFMSDRCELPWRSAIRPC
jgi:hypothetical protein